MFQSADNLLMNMNRFEGDVHMSDAKENFVGFCTLAGAGVGLYVINQKEPGAEAGAYIGGAIGGAIVGAIAGHLVWLAIVIAIGLVIFAVNTAGFFAASEVRKEVGKEIISQFKGTEGQSTPRVTPPATANSTTPNGLKATVCVQNQLGVAFTYDYRWGSDNWQSSTIQPNRGLIHYQILYGQQVKGPKFEIYYDTIGGDGKFTGYRKALSQNTIRGKESCDTAERYKLSWLGDRIMVNRAN